MYDLEIRHYRKKWHPMKIIAFHIQLFDHSIAEKLCPGVAKSFTLSQLWNNVFGQLSNIPFNFKISADNLPIVGANIM